MPRTVRGEFNRHLHERLRVADAFDALDLVDERYRKRLHEVDARVVVLDPVELKVDGAVVRVEEGRSNEHERDACGHAEGSVDRAAGYPPDVAQGQLDDAWEALERRQQILDQQAAARWWRRGPHRLGRADA